MTTTAELSRLRTALGSLAGGVGAAERIDRLRLLEEIKSAAAAAQALEAAAFADAARQANLDAGVPAPRADRGVASQVGLAMRMSPFRAQRFVGWARVLVRELPGTFTELAAGRTTEWRATLVARETACLSREHRAQADAQLAPHLQGWGDRQVESETARVAYRLDPEGYVARLAAAEADRHVSMRPVPDVMTRLSAVLPVARGVACYASLCRWADGHAGVEGETRSRGQLIADRFVQLLTGEAVAERAGVEIELIMSSDTLFGGRNVDEPAHVLGYGPVPAGWARDVALSGDGPRWLRRLFTRPETGQLIAMETHRRLFTDNQRRFVRLRDQACATPWCSAPARHTDHVLAHENGGPTSVANGQALCAACNHAKQAPRWSARRDPSSGETTVITPTGHSYRSRAPDPPASSTAALLRSPIHWPRIELTWFGHAA